MNESANAVEQVVLALQSRRAAGHSVSMSARIELCRESLAAVVAAADDWANAAIKAKGLPDGSPLLAEDILSGPVVVARQLRLMMQTLQSIVAGKPPRLPGSCYRLTGGRLAVPVFPTSGYFDSLTFMGLKAHVRMNEGIDASQIHGGLLKTVQFEETRGISVVLGAGNVSSIPATDSLHQIVFEGRQVLLKMNPVNEYLAPIFRRAFAAFIREGLLEIVTGAADVGSLLIHHSNVDCVHITGAAATHDAIVWGTDADDAAVRRRENRPLLNKPVTSELGNVTPWIIVPGQYSKRQLESQVKHVAASITNNASFNCLATKVILTWDKWTQREQFLSMLQQCLEKIPPRPAYYPGAEKRFQRFASSDVSVDERNGLPWTLLIDQSISERPELFQEESFVCVCAETQLAADSPEQFLQVATEFVNNQMGGTLCASVTVPTEFRKSQAAAFNKCLDDLRYGSVCINQWSGLAYGFTSPPWGAYPGNTIQNVGSGIGSVHNTYLLDRFEKTVLEGPLINFPTPVWFSDNRNAVNVAKYLLQLYHRPSVFRLPKLFVAALNG
ncbi:MAG: aldehyde dehydrogenase family protein [Fuerstiella sp.]